MKTRRKYLIGIVIPGLLLGCTALMAGVNPEMITPGDETALSVFDDPALTRKAVKADSYTLNTTSPSVNDQVVFRFFEDTVYTMRVSRVFSGYNGDVVIEGNSPQKTTVLFRQVVSADGTRTELEDTERGFFYQALPDDNASLRILEFDRSKGEAVVPTNPLPVPGETAVPGPLIDLLAAGDEVETLATTDEIDVMLVFDQTAQSWANANGGVTAFANAVISKMNTAHELSGTETAFRLVHIYLSSHTYNSSTSTLSDELYDIYYETGGFGDVSDLRDSVGADLAAARVDTGSAYGTTVIGFRPGGSSGSSSAAFSVNSIRAVNNRHTLTHEIGHNLGSGHSKVQTTQPGPGIFSYAAGWYFTGSNNTKYHTIMSYNSNGGTYYYPCGLFSSPLLTFQGVVAGNATDGDNARCIRQMNGVVAAYRASAVNTVSAPVISPASGTTFSGSLQVSMSCATTGAQIRYTTNGADPTQTSTLYSGPVTITQSTSFKAVGFKTGMDPSAITTAGYSKIAANDFFADAIPISDIVNSTAGNNINCTAESGEPSHYYTARTSALWKWTAPKSGEVTFSTYGSDFDTMMAAYTGTTLASLTRLDSDDDSGGTLQSQVTFPVTAGADYYIAVDGYGGNEGSISLNWNLEYLEIGSSSIVDSSGSPAFRMQFNARAGETYVVKRKNSLDPAEPWVDCNPPVELTAGSDGTYSLDVAIPAEGGSGFFKVVRE